MITAYDYHTSGKPIRLLCIHICLLLIATLVSACGGSDNPPDATIVIQPRCGATGLPPLATIHLISVVLIQCRQDLVQRH